MGMFDSMYDNEGNEWQTKAYDLVLDSFRIGDSVTYMGTDSYQAKVLGDIGEDRYGFSYATIRNSTLESIGDPRDETLPLLDYHGGWIVKEEA